MKAGGGLGEGPTEEEQEDGRERAERKKAKDVAVDTKGTGDAGNQV